MEVPFANWGALAEAVRAEMAAWRASHPKATLAEIETALDSCMYRARAQMLTDIAQASPLADLATLPTEQRPLCPDCGRPLQARGAKTRQGANRGRVRSGPHPLRSRLPCLPSRAFPPWMTNSVCCRAV